jgi:RNA polymerase sigma-70 factor (ECF subfamily)
MIQIGAACVLTTMNSALPSLAAPARADNGPAQARAPAGCVCLVAVERGGNMSSPQFWDRLIVSLATDRDREAFASLFAHFAPRLKTFMLRQGMDKAGAEELAQEAMLAVWRKADLYDPQTASAAAWIFAIARNLRIDALRRERGGWMGGNFEVEAEFQVDDSPLPDQRLADSQSQERVRAALGRLSADQLQVIELSYYEEKAHGDIANTLGIPLGTVKSRLRLAMGRLRELLREPS